MTYCTFPTKVWMGCFKVHHMGLQVTKSATAYCNNVVILKYGHRYHVTYFKEIFFRIKLVYDDNIKLSCYLFCVACMYQICSCLVFSYSLSNHIERFFDSFLLISSIVGQFVSVPHMCASTYPHQMSLV